MKIRTTVFAAVLMAAAFADNTAPDVATHNSDGMVRIGDRMVSREHLKDALGRVKYKRNGGYVRKSGSAKGFFVLLNAQKSVPPADFSAALKVIDEQVLVQTKVLEVDKAHIDTMREAMTQSGAGVGVAVVESESLPALLAAPEEGWGMVNVAKLRDSDPGKFAARVRLEILRAFGLAAGAMYAAQGDFVLQPVRKPSDLDSIKRQEFGVMMRRIFPLSLPYFGITPWHQATYQKAVQEGWAPAPTNEYQKAIWDKVHEMPTEPIKIKPETRKVQQ